jgi:hypothetical protein
MTPAKKDTSRPRWKHGHSPIGKSTATYRTWSHVIQRTTNPQQNAYPHYGGRGITVCDRWRDFRNFLEDMGERPPGKTIDRINNDLGYYKENCRWATIKEQHANRRTPKNHVEITGQRFGRLIALRFSYRNRHGQGYWICRCDCGNEVIVQANALKTSNTNSCGCLRKETAVQNRANARKRSRANVSWESVSPAS